MSNNDINSEAISKSLDKLAHEEKIKENIYKEIIGRRNFVESQIHKYVDDTNVKISDKFNVGSYKIKTGVKYHDNSFDIDYAFVFNNLPNYSDFKENLTINLRKKIKEHYKRGVKVSSKKSVIAIRYLW